MKDTIPKLLNENLSKTKNEICFAKRKFGKWEYYTKKEYIQTSNNIAFGLLKLGVSKKEKIIIISENNPEWHFIDLAIMKLGAISIPLYSIISDSQLEIILTETDAKYIFVSNKYLNRKINNTAKKLKKELIIISLEKTNTAINLDELIRLGKNNTNHKKIKSISNGIQEDDTYTILYTSGTTMHPRGVMLSHKNHLIVINEGYNRLNIKDGYKTIQYLPLNNSFGRTISYIAQIAGMTIYYINGITNIEKHISEINPDFIASTPYLLRKFMKLAQDKSVYTSHESIRQFENARNLIDNYESYSKLVNDSNFNQINNLFFKQWKKLIGNNIKTILAGGAIVNKDIYNFYNTIGIKLLNGYGLTETSAVISLDSYNEKTKAEHCGKLITGMSIMISDKNEILVKGKNIMQGYYKHKDITNETIDSDGWLYTGDIGNIDKDGYVTVTGRIKSSFKLNSGVYVYPESIEEKFNGNKYIERIVITGFSKEYIIALIKPKIKNIINWLNKNNKIVSENKILEDNNIIELFSSIINNYNSIIYGPNKRIEKFILINDTFNNNIPISLLERNIIIKKYQNKLNKLYN